MTQITAPARVAPRSSTAPRNPNESSLPTPDRPTTEPSPIEVRLLGPVEVLRNGRPVMLTGTKLRVVLVMLALHAGRSVTTAQLSETLWGDSMPPTAAAQLHTYVSRLRGMLGEDFTISRSGSNYMLDAGAATFDLQEFNRHREAGSRALSSADHTTAAAEFRAALSLWRGSALSNLGDHLRSVAQSLNDERLDVLESLFDVELHLGSGRSLIPELSALTDAFPFRENFRRQLMIALAENGRQADAIETYHRGRALLVEELGVDPGPALADAYQRILQMSGGPEPPAADAAPPAPHPGEEGTSGVAAVERTGDVPARPTLPPDQTALVGRETELAFATRMLDPDNAGASRRLVISGLPGIGKSALALRLAHDVSAHYPDGQIHVSLRRADGRARATGSAMVEILTLLGHTVPHFELTNLGEQQLTQFYRRCLAETRVLLILDNIAFLEQMQPVIPPGPGSGVVITSPQVVPVPGAAILSLQPLSPADGAQLALLLTPPGLLSEEDAVRLSKACGGVAGAVHLAAARLTARAGAGVAHYLDSLEDPRRCFRLLTAGSSALADSFALVWSTLQPATQEALTTLTHFGRAPFTSAEAASHVQASDEQMYRALESLVDHTLLHTEGDGYVMNPLVLSFIDCMNADAD